MTQVGRWRSENFIAQEPAFELANTISHRRDPALSEDRLDDVQSLADWVCMLGIREVAAPLGNDDLLRSKWLRERIYKVFEAVASEREPPRDAVADLLGAAAEGFKRPDPPRLHEYLAWRAVNALAALSKERIGICPACGWLFYDTSRGGRRRWCSMATCGTANKVRAFRARKGGKT